MPDNRFDSGTPHVVLPVKTVDGDIHNVAVQPDTDLQDLHTALASDPTYAHPFPSEQPAKEGSIEYDPRFRKAASDAWERVGNGSAKAESGFVIGRTGGTVPAGVAPGHSLQLTNLPGGVGNLHTHQNGAYQGPSDADIQDAKNDKEHRTYYVASKGGLYSVNHAGEITHIFSNTDWASSKNPQ
jgi:hypothetical protein